MIHLSLPLREIWVLLSRSGWIILVLIEAKGCQDEATGLFEVSSRGGSGEATQCNNSVIDLSFEPWFPYTETVSL